MSEARSIPAWRSRMHPSWIAFLIHRLSGLALALFIPVHFWALGRIVESEAALDAVLAWSAHPLVKLAETGLVIALALHLAGGIRLLGVEFALWRGRPGAAFAGMIGFALAAGLLFLLNAVSG
ncbi:MAG: succinate dehydrogenase, cytochrome b556 subunit [Rhodospirillales bacterium]|nr:succinate dehydrogenase, cytochrome b556 subunit [Rhodospirillales bacterium]MSP80416.1 succinate dehydrogenase, cytochrome b556 subunit [Rhodospirillales bacterium]